MSGNDAAPSVTGRMRLQLAYDPDTQRFHANYDPEAAPVGVSGDAAPYGSIVQSVDFVSVWRGPDGSMLTGISLSRPGSDHPAGLANGGSTADFNGKTPLGHWEATAYGYTDSLPPYINIDIYWTHQ